MLKSSGKGYDALMEALSDSPGSLVLEIGSLDSGKTLDYASEALGNRFVELEVALDDWVGFVSLHFCFSGSGAVFGGSVFLTC